MQVDGTNTGGAMKSPVVKRSIVIAGHKTSVSLEDAFWKGLKDIAFGRRITLSDLVGAIDSERQHGNLSSAIRLFVLDHYQAKPDGEVQSKQPPHDMMIVQLPTGKHDLQTPFVKSTNRPDPTAQQRSAVEHTIDGINQPSTPGLQRI
jgi:predicted DNA-binding ribbon-helix-helix protein